MRITKLVHSCLLVDDEGRVALFDPGEFSTELLAQQTIGRLDDLIISHEHGDHCDVPAIAALLTAHPETAVTAPAAVLQLLKDSGVKVKHTTSPATQTFSAPHEGTPPFISPPEATGVHYLGKLSHAGDSHHFSETKAILALAISAPWGSTDAAVQLALQLKPRYIIPIHDWHWRDEVRDGMYARLEKLFAAEGITFISPVNGKPFEIDL